MITSIRIDDNKKTPFKYIQKIKAFKNGSEFIFKPGVNVIVGKNGSGKSTLLNMISKYMLCEKKMCSELPSEALYFPDIFDDDKVLDGISIKSDYIGKVFHLLQQTEMRKDDILDNINNLSLYMNGASRSSGEKNLHAMNSLFDFVFNQDEYAFPIQKLMEFKKKSNEFWANRIDNPMYNEATLKEEFTSSVRLAVIRELKEKFKNELMREISNPISEKIEDIARESMSDLIENASEKKYRFRLDYMDEELTVDEFIRGRMKKVVDSNIETMVESKAKSFVNELRKRYDMAFAAFVVDNMRKQNMLKEDKIAELLKDNPNEK